MRGLNEKKGRDLHFNKQQTQEQNYITRLKFFFLNIFSKIENEKIRKEKLAVSIVRRTRQNQHQKWATARLVVRSRRRFCPCRLIRSKI